MERDDELDIVIMEDDDGKEVPFQVLSYLNYEGREYALLTEYVPEEEMSEDVVYEAFPMEVRAIPGDEENEEFVPIEDEALADAVIEIFQNTDFEEDDE